MEKNLGLAMLVPVIWVASVLVVLVETLVAPFVFIWALFRPEGIRDIIDSITGSVSDLF